MRTLVHETLFFVDDASSLVNSIVSWASSTIDQGSSELDFGFSMAREYDTYLHVYSASLFAVLSRAIRRRFRETAPNPLIRGQVPC